MKLAFKMIENSSIDTYLMVCLSQTEGFDRYQVNVFIAAQSV